MTLFLIAHKVHGEVAFDVAIKMEMPDEVWWVIPTSGHRAYPLAHVPLEQATKAFVDAAHFYDLSDLRDHYEVSRDPPAPDYTNRATEPPRSGRPIVPTLEDI